MELWVAKDKDGETYLYEKEPVVSEDGVWYIPEESEVDGGFMAAKIGAVLGAGQKALVKSFNVKTGAVDLEIWQDPHKRLLSTVAGFLSGKVTKAELGRVFKGMSKPSK